MNTRVNPSIFSARFRVLLALLIGLGIALVCPLSLMAKDSPEGLTDENRVAIIRGVSSEFARTRITLPRGNKPVVLNDKGEYNENDLKVILMKFGPAVDVGQEVQITRVEFRKEDILFDINGGGKKKRKWTEHVQVGIGGATTPLGRSNPEAPTGSSLLLHFKGSVPNLTVADVKQLLGRVLNFSPQSASENYVDTLPPEFKEAVAKHEPRVGMDHDMVVAAMGRPDRKIREKNSEGVDQEQWIYGNPPGRVVFVVFEGDKVVSIKEY